MNGPYKYRKRPIVVEAVKWDGSLLSANAIVLWSVNRVRPFGMNRAPNVGPIQLIVDTPNGEVEAEPGDWIIRGSKDDFYPCKPETFNNIYELAE